MYTKVPLKNFYYGSKSKFVLSKFVRTNQDVKKIRFVHLADPTPSQKENSLK